MSEGQPSVGEYHDEVERLFRTLFASFPEQADQDASSARAEGQAAEKMSALPHPIWWCLDPVLKALGDAGAAVVRWTQDTGSRAGRANRIEQASPARPESGSHRCGRADLACGVGRSRNMAHNSSNVKFHAT